MKKLLVIGLLVVGGLWVCRNTNLRSYISTLWCRGQNALKNQVPRDLEIERLRNEIAQLDTRVRDLIGPIADKQVRIQELDGQVKTARANQATLKQSILALSKEVDKGGTFINWENEEYTIADARRRLESDLGRFEDLNSAIKHREQALTSLRQSVGLVTQQLKTLKEQKLTFEARLTLIEATHESLVTREGHTGRGGDQNPVGHIDRSLKDLERQLKVEMRKLELEQQFLNQQSSAPSPSRPTLTTDQIRTRLGVTTTTPAPKVAHSDN
jgi:chromosome segregation ATPase